MTEERLRELHKKYLEDPTDKWARYRYRLECVRMGIPDEAGPLEPGDTVIVGLRAFYGGDEAWCCPGARGPALARIQCPLKDPLHGDYHKWRLECVDSLHPRPNEVPVSGPAYRARKLTLLSPALPSES